MKLPEGLDESTRKYFETFTEEERIAAVCDGEGRCQICNKGIFFTDIFNFEDIKPDYMRIICGECRDKYKKAFEEKRQRFIHER